MTGFYNDFFPVTFIHHEYKETTIPRLLNRQKMILKKILEEKMKEKDLLTLDLFLSWMIV